MLGGEQGGTISSGGSNLSGGEAFWIGEVLVRAVFDRDKRIEGNETLKRAFHLAESGLYLGWRDIERQLIREQRP